MDLEEAMTATQGSKRNAPETPNEIVNIKLI